MRKRSTRGFNLIEIAVVMSIAAVIAAITLPMLSSWRSNRDVANLADRLASDIRHAVADSQASSVGAAASSSAAGVATINNGSYAVVNGATTSNVISAPTMTFLLSPSAATAPTLTAGRAVLFLNGTTPAGSVLISSRGTVGCFTNGVWTNAGPQIIVENSQVAYLISVSRLGAVKITPTAQTSSPPADLPAN